MLLYAEYCYQNVLISSLKCEGFIPETGSEVYVKNIPKDAIDIYELARFFAPAGQIFQIRLKMRKDKRGNRGYAYVCYLNSDMAKTALRLRDRPFRENACLVIERSLNNCRIFVGGIPVSKSKNDVWRELNFKGVKGIVDVIMYRSHSDRSVNRGYVFVEFRTHEQAALFRAQHVDRLKLFGKPVVIEWSIPIPNPDEAVLATVTNIYVGNLKCCWAVEQFRPLLHTLVAPQELLKVYRLKNYALIHVRNRRAAEDLFQKLVDHFRNTIVNVQWAKPPNQFTSPEYRSQKLLSISRNSLSRTDYSRSTNSPGPSTFVLSPSPPRSISPIDSDIDSGLANASTISLDVSESSSLDFSIGEPDVLENSTTPLLSGEDEPYDPATDAPTTPFDITIRPPPTRQIPTPAVDDAFDSLERITADVLRYIDILPTAPLLPAEDEPR